MDVYPFQQRRIKMATRSQNGYSLIELLIVIATVAVMAAILFPVFTSPNIRDAAKNADKQNTKKIAAAILQYAADNDGKFPRSGYDCLGHDNDPSFAPGESNQCGGDTWQDAVGPYVGDKWLFLAPKDFSEPGEGAWGGGTGDDFNATDDNLSFVINDLLAHKMPNNAGGYADPANADFKADGLRVSDVKSPSQCLLISEGHSGWNKVSSPGAQVVVTDWTGSTDLQNKWHHDYSFGFNCSFLITSHSYDGTNMIRIGLPFVDHGGNVAFVDGHQKFIAFENTTGAPILCQTLPWTLSMDPKQRNADRNSCSDPNNPLPAGWTAPNWF
jgi:prepilin-type N-terminal cleavage/methylation domain-containing protein/prepilin-type processing-associated H-X9-DG protein